MLIIWKLIFYNDHRIGHQMICFSKSQLALEIITSEQFHQDISLKFYLSSIMRTTQTYVETDLCSRKSIISTIYWQIWCATVVDLFAILIESTRKRSVYLVACTRLTFLRIGTFQNDSCFFRTIHFDSNQFSPTQHNSIDIQPSRHCKKEFFCISMTLSSLFVLFQNRYVLNRLVHFINEWGKKTTQTTKLQKKNQFQFDRFSIYCCIKTFMSWKVLTGPQVTNVMHKKKLLLWVLIIITWDACVFQYNTLAKTEVMGGLIFRLLLLLLLSHIC